MKFMPVLLALVLLGCPPAAPADFRALAEKAYPEGAPADRIGQDALWTALFRLPQWHFVMTNESAAAKQPAAQTIGGEAWLLVFTDLDMLKMYAFANKTALDGGALSADAGSQFVFNLPAGDAGAAAATTLSPNMSSDGKPLFVSMTPNAARAFLATYKGPAVSGIRFNEGTRKGWFAPISAVNNIHDMLKANGKF